MRPRSSLLAALLGASVALGIGEIGLRVLGLGDPILYDNRDAYGYRPLPSQTRRRLRGARVHVNALGVRGPDVPAMPAPDTLRLLFLGDSVSWGGSYIDDDDLFAAVAARTIAATPAGRFRAVEPLDAGVNAWGPENILGLLDTEPSGFGSQVWVLTLLEDDFGREKTRIGEVPYFMTAPLTAWEELLALGAYRLLGAYKRPKPESDLARIGERNLATCRVIVGRARAAGARVVLVWHPTAAALDGTAEPHRQPFLDLAESADTAGLDLTAPYRLASDAGARLHIDGMHLSVAGHALAGREIGRRVVALLAARAP